MDWTAALATALLGVPVNVSADTPAGVVAALGAERIGAVAEDRHRTGEPWPFPVQRPADFGPARWAAVLTAATGEVRRGTGSAQVVRQRPLDADERRLLDDVPPHHLG